MLIALRRTDKVPLSAMFAEASDGELMCPQCHKAVQLSFGSAVSRHFVHKDSPPCSFDAGESEIHRKAKSAIYEALLKHPEATNVQLELPLRTVRPDIYAHIRGSPVAIEVQVSTLSEATITRRTEEYARLGISVLWLLPWTPELQNTHYSPRRFERWLHAVYFGRVYFWKEDLTILPYYFHTQEIEVKPRAWRDEHGRIRKAKGYRRVSRRQKMPICGRGLHLVRDFRKRTRTAWQTEDMDVPAANLFMDGSRFLPEYHQNNFSRLDLS